MITDIIKGVTDIANKVAGNIFPDPKDEIKKQELAQQIQNQLLTSQSNIINAETKGESWLQRNWRPLTMLTFVSLVVAKWLGFTVDGVTEAIELELLGIIKVGLGGYVLGRSAEKLMKEYKK
jgi:hypothetical protein